MSYFVAQVNHPVIDALLRAYSRGVDVRVVLDSGDGQKAKKNQSIDYAYARLAETLSPGRTKQCNRSCITDEPVSINHNKFATFSRTGNAVHTVFQSTGNLRPDGSGDSAYNAAVVLYGDQPMYNQYVGYFEDLFIERRVPRDNYDAYRPPATSGPITAHFFPRTDKKDTLAGWLNTINCAAEPTSVRVMAAFFSRKSVRNALVKLGEAGCGVEVLARQETITQDFCKSLGPKVSVKISPSPKRDRVTIHAKYVLIGGSYGGASDQRITWMGSHNLTQTALDANDETLLQFVNPEVYTAFFGNWDRLWNDPSMTPGCVRAGARSEAEVERRADTETTKLSRRSQSVKRALPKTLRKSQAIRPVRTAQGRPITTVAYCKPAGSKKDFRRTSACRVVKRKGVPTVVISSRSALRVRILQKAPGSTRLLPYSRTADYRYSPKSKLARRV
jgi:phosphatidylserine/phosphatidylglycerophosphate/cardiolipin synthase-like enzyme